MSQYIPADVIISLISCMINEAGNFSFRLQSVGRRRATGMMKRNVDVA